MKEQGECSCPLTATSKIGKICQNEEMCVNSQTSTSAACLSSCPAAPQPVTEKCFCKDGTTEVNVCNEGSICKEGQCEDATTTTEKTDSTSSISTYSVSSGCATGWIQFGQTGNCYKYMETKMNWHEALEQCKANSNGTLASVPSKETNDFLLSLITEFVWIGGLDRNKERIWEWSDGTPWGYENWFVGGSVGKSNWSPQPDNYGGNEYCIGMMKLGTDASGQWFDAPFSSKINFICQYEAGTILIQSYVYCIYTVSFL